MAKDNDPNRLSPVALRMKQDLQLNGKSERTQESYVRMLRKFSEFLKREPDSATEDDLRNYLLFIKNQRQWRNSAKLIEKPSMLCFFTVVYSLRLRLQEALHLQVSDIDSKRMVVQEVA